MFADVKSQHWLGVEPVLRIHLFDPVTFRHVVVAVVSVVYGVPSFASRFDLDMYVARK